MNGDHRFTVKSFSETERFSSASPGSSGTGTEQANGWLQPHWGFARAQQRDREDEEVNGVARCVLVTGGERMDVKVIVMIVAKRVEEVIPGGE